MGGVFKGGPVGSAAGAIAPYLAGRMRGAGLQRADELVCEAMLDPATARRLRAQVPAASSRSAELAGDPRADNRPRDSPSRSHRQRSASPGRDGRTGRVACRRRANTRLRARACFAHPRGAGLSRHSPMRHEPGRRVRSRRDVAGGAPGCRRTGGNTHRRGPPPKAVAPHRSGAIRLAQTLAPHSCRESRTPVARRASPRRARSRPIRIANLRVSYGSQGSARCLIDGGSDGARTRGLRRDRPAL